MFLYCIFTYVVANILVVKSHLLHEAYTKDNKQELKSIIKSLNDVNEDLKANHEYDKIAAGNIDLNDQEKEEKLQKIMWLIKKNYNARTHHDFIKNSLNSGARLYFIKNPEVIEDYKKYLKGKKLASSNKKDLSDNEHGKRGAKQKLQELRRQIMFRLSHESRERPEDDIDNRHTNIEDNNPKEEDRDNDNLTNEDIEKAKIKLPIDSQVNTNEDIEEKERKIPIDTLQLYNKDNTHFRREKAGGDEEERLKHWDRKQDKYKSSSKDRNRWEISRSKEIKEESRSKDYRNWEVKSRENDWTKDTKDWTKSEYKRLDEDNKKISYRKPKSNIKLRDDFAIFGRTPIPYVGKKGIFEDD